MVHQDWRARVAASFGIVPEFDARERLLKSCAIIGDCWIWQRRGQYTIRRKRFPPPQMAFVMMKGELRADEGVKTSCGNAKCCNPAHLDVDVYVEQFRKAQKLNENMPTGAARGADDGR